MREHDKHTMSQVSGRMIADLLDGVDRLGHDPDPLLEGLSIERAALRVGHPRYAWSDFVVVMERLERLLGGPQGLERAGGGFDRITVAPVLRRIAGFTATPHALYSAAQRWALPRVIPQLESRIDPIDSGRLRIVCRIPGSDRPCPQLFHLATGAIRSCPTLLGLPHAEVIADIQPRFGQWIVAPPASRSLTARLRTAIRAAFSTRAAFEQLEKQQHELQRGFEELEAAYSKLEESEERYRALAETATDSIVEFAPDLHVLYANPATAQVVGMEEIRPRAIAFEDWVHPDDRTVVADYLTATFEHRERATARPIFRLRTSDESVRFYEMEARLYRRKTGEDCTVAILRDVDQRIASEARDRDYRETLEREVADRTRELERKNRDLRELQTLLLDAERMGTARDLAGRVAHSINNPLGALVTELSLLLHQSGGKDPRLAELLELAHHVGDVVKRTLELYREGKIDRRPEEIEDILADLRRNVTSAAENKAVVLSIEAGSAIPAIAVDRPLLVTALESLVINAIEALPRGGHVSVEVEHDPDANCIRILVGDDGSGIPESDRERIFEPFYTTRETGTGLGLPIANGVIRGHQGELRLEDSREGGARFVIELPLAPRI